MSESQNIEYKESWRDEYLKWICGFANAQGGKLYIGIDDKGNVVGVENIKKLMEDIPNKVNSQLGILVDVNKRRKGGKYYIEIGVNPSSFPISYHGEYHFRSGSTKQQLTGMALTEFIMRKTGARWEDVTVDDISVEDLDAESFKIFRREALRSKRMTEEDLNVPNEELLSKLHLMRNGKLKRSAVLLFYHDPAVVQNGSHVQIGKFSSGADLQYQDILDGSLISTADRVIDLIYLKYLKAKITYEHDRRVETYPFARDAVREAVYNAIAHNCYMYGTPIQIRIEDEAMIISNRCVLPEGWTVETLMNPHDSIPYNPDIAGVFYLAGYIERWGRGVEKICDACKAIGADLPQYELRGNGLRIHFPALQEALIEDSKAQNSQSAKTPKRQNPKAPKHQNAKASDGERAKTQGSSEENSQSVKTPKRQNSKAPRFQNDALDDRLAEKVIELLKKNPKITQDSMIHELGISRRTLQRQIVSLRTAGRIERIGGKRYGYWEVLS